MGLVLVNDKVVEASYLRHYCYFVVNKLFAAYLAAEVVGRSWVEPEASARRPAPKLELDSLNASVFRFGGPSC